MLVCNSYSNGIKNLFKAFDEQIYFLFLINFFNYKLLTFISMTSNYPLIFYTMNINCLNKFIA